MNVLIAIAFAGTLFLSMLAIIGLGAILEAWIWLRGLRGWK